MLGDKKVTIDFLPDSPFRYVDYDAVVCIDVIRATTTLVTAVAQGRSAYPAGSVQHALDIAKDLKDPLLAAEVRGGKPDGFEMGNSPAALARRSDTHRPLVLASTSGTPLIDNARGCRAVYVACFRNLEATAKHVAAHHARVAILGAGSHGRLRCEDQMAAARLGAMFVQRGFEPETSDAADLILRWRDACVSLAGLGSSSEYLRRSGQVEDIDFVLEHVDDLDLVCRYERGEVRSVEPARAAAKTRLTDLARPSGRGAALSPAPPRTGPTPGSLGIARGALQPGSGT